MAKVLLIVLILLVSSAVPTARAQAGFSAELLQRDMQNVAMLTKKYYKKNNNLPTDGTSSDQLLYQLYKRSRDYNPNQPLPYPSNDGIYRVLGRFRVAFDLGINQESNTLIAWRKNPPDDWKGRGGTIGVLSNGETKFLIYGIGDNGRPIRSSNGLAIYDVYDCETGEEDERIL